MFYLLRMKLLLYISALFIVNQALCMNDEVSRIRDKVSTIRTYELSKRLANTPYLNTQIARDYMRSFLYDCRYYPKDCEVICGSLNVSRIKEICLRLFELGKQYIDKSLTERLIYIYYTLDNVEGVLNTSYEYIITATSARFQKQCESYETFLSEIEEFARKKYNELCGYEEKRED